MIMIKHLNYFWKQNNLSTTTQRIWYKQDFLLGIKSKWYLHIHNQSGFLCIADYMYIQVIKFFLVVLFCDPLMLLVLLFLVFNCQLFIDPFLFHVATSLHSYQEGYTISRRTLVSLRMFFLYNELTTCLTRPTLLSWNIKLKNCKLIITPMQWFQMVKKLSIKDK